MQETLLADPASALDQLAMHDRDLPCRSAEGSKGNAGPHAVRLGEGHQVLSLRHGRTVALGQGGEERLGRRSNSEGRCELAPMLFSGSGGVGRAGFVA